MAVAGHTPFHDLCDPVAHLFAALALHGVHMALGHVAHGVADRILYAGLIGAVGQIPDDKRVLDSPRHRSGEHDHLVHGGVQGVGIA